VLRSLFKIVAKFPNKKSLLWKAFFYLFWKLEEREEERNLGIPVSLPISGSERAVFIETILSKDFTSLLDVGTAYGQNLFILSKLVDPKILYGSDLNTNRLLSGKQIAEDKRLTSINFLSTNACSLPLSDKSFDIVTASALFLYLDRADSILALREMFRVSTGRIVLLEQHVSGEREVCLEGEVTGGSFWIRDYHLLFKEAFSSKFEVLEYRIPNPRWQIERWENTGRVFEILF